MTEHSGLTVPCLLVITNSCAEHDHALPPAGSERSSHSPWSRRRPSLQRPIQPRPRRCSRRGVRSSIAVSSVPPARSSRAARPASLREDAAQPRGLPSPAGPHRHGLGTLRRRRTVVEGPGAAGAGRGGSAPARRARTFIVDAHTRHAAAKPPGLEVRVNGRSLDPGSLDSRLPMDPGGLSIEFSAPGRKSARVAAVLLSKGHHLVVNVPELAAEVAPRQYPRYPRRTRRRRPRFTAKVVRKPAATHGHSRG